MHGSARLARRAAETYGYFTLETAARERVTTGELRSELERGGVVRCHEGVYRFVAAKASWRGELLAACWAGGPSAIASHRSAAALWGLAGARRGLPEITCPRWRRNQEPGILVHESTRLAQEDRALVDGVPVTSIEATLLGIAAVCSASTAEMALDAAERRDLVTLTSVSKVLGRLGGRGCPGSATLRRLLDARSVRATVPESEMETRLLQVLRRHGLPEPSVQHEITSAGTFVARVDAAYPEWSIAIEYESYRHHSGRTAQDRDHERRLRIQAAGFEVVEVGWAELAAGGPRLVAAISNLRQRRAPQHTG